MLFSDWAIRLNNGGVFQIQRRLYGFCVQESCILWIKSRKCSSQLGVAFTEVNFFPSPGLKLRIETTRTVSHRTKIEKHEDALVDLDYG